MGLGIVQNGSYQVYSCNPPVQRTHPEYPIPIWALCRVDRRILAQHPGKTRVAVSLKSTISQLIGSCSTPLSPSTTRDAILLICQQVPWFCHIITLNKEGCMSSQSNPPTTSTKATGENPPGVGGVRRGKENFRAEVEGLMIFAKRDGEIIRRNQVLSELRHKRTDLKTA